MTSKKKVPNFNSLFDKKTKALLKFILDRGFILTLVGGAVRDYLLNGKLPADLDFELRSIESINEEDWLVRIDELSKALEKEFKLSIETLDYGIFRFVYGKKDFEFSTPRLETFLKTTDHKNFNADLISNLDYSEAFKRRDFTINAMAFEINGNKDISFIDPFDGKKDLEGRVLRPCGVDFNKDPVRFLRLVRFQLQTGFSLADELRNGMRGFILTELTPFYVIKEALKSLPYSFFNKVFEYSERNKLKLPQALFRLSFLGAKKVGKNSKIDNKKDFLLDMIFNKRFQDSEIENFANYLTIKKSDFQNALQFRKSLDNLQKIDLDQLAELVRAKEIGEIKDNMEINQLVRFHSLFKRTINQHANYLKFTNEKEGETYKRFAKLLFANNQSNRFVNIPPKLRKVAEIYYLLRK